MRACIAAILLFFYSLTSIGATVYLHQCHGVQVFFSQKEKAPHHADCALCLKQHKDEQQTDHAHGCGHASVDDDCCKNIVLDLKKGQEEVESVKTPFSFPSFSPATFTILWITVFHADTAGTNPQPTSGSQTIHPSLPPAYLVHCNFRI